MGKRHKPRRGSMGFSPRKRAASIVPGFSSWPEREGKPKLQGFVGFKAGMTHLMVNDTRKRSTTENQSIVYPVTVIEVPPVKVVALKFYRRNTYGIEAKSEIWMNDLAKNFKEIGKVITIRNNDENKKKIEKGVQKEKEQQTAKITKESVLKDDEIEEVRAIVATQPNKSGGLSTKKPHLMEVRIGGGLIKERIEYGFSLLGTNVKFTEFLGEQKVVDIAAITKGKGFQGHIKRWGVKLQPRKNSKHRRMIGTLGPHNPSYVLPTVPQSGQMGFHQRTEYNKRVVAYVSMSDSYPLSDELLKDLQAGNISKDMKNLFSSNKISLSNNATISSLGANEWKITDEKETYYIIENKGNIQITKGEKEYKAEAKSSTKLTTWTITPKGGFLKYGLLNSDAVLLHGSVPGTPKRLIRFRDPVRLNKKLSDMPIVYVSNTSKQGA